MDLRDRRYAVLLVSASEKTTSSLKALLPESLYSPVAEARDIQSARRALYKRKSRSFFAGSRVCGGNKKERRSALFKRKSQR